MFSSQNSSITQKFEQSHKILRYRFGFAKNVLCRYSEKDAVDVRAQHGGPTDRALQQQGQHSGVDGQCGSDHGQVVGHARHRPRPRARHTHCLGASRAPPAVTLTVCLFTFHILHTRYSLPLFVSL